MIRKVILFMTFVMFSGCNDDSPGDCSVSEYSPGSSDWTAVCAAMLSGYSGMIDEMNCSEQTIVGPFEAIDRCDIESIARGFECLCIDDDMISACIRKQTEWIGDNCADGILMRDVPLDFPECSFLGINRWPF